MLWMDVVRGMTRYMSGGTPDRHVYVGASPGMCRFHALYTPLKNIVLYETYWTTEYCCVSL